MTEARNYKCIIIIKPYEKRTHPTSLESRIKDLNSIFAQIDQAAYRPVWELIAGVEHPVQPSGKLVGSYRTKQGIDQREPWLSASSSRARSISRGFMKEREGYSREGKSFGEEER